MTHCAIFAGRLTTMIARIILVCVCLFGLYGGVMAQVKVLVKDIKYKTGNIYLAVYNHPDDYMKPDRAYQKKIVAVKAMSETEIDLGFLPSGYYAILLFLDENGNGNLDKNMWGVPKEKYGFSGDRHPLMRAPKFEEATVHVNKAASLISISLK